MQSPSDDPDDADFDQQIDNAIVLMSLLIARTQLHKFKASKKVLAIVKGRIEKLIELYRNPDIQ